MLPQRIEEGDARLDVELMALPVDIERQMDGSCHDKLLLSSREWKFMM
jgi:hypothetical protein